MTEVVSPGRRIFRKRLIIPTEHGAWSWLLVPFFVGAAVAGPAAGDGDRLALLPLVLTLMGRGAGPAAPMSH